MLFEQTKPFENLTTIEPAEKTQITSSKMSVTKYLFSELFNRERSVFPKPRTNTFKGAEVFLLSVRAFCSPIVTSAVPSRCRADQLPGGSRGAGWAAGSAPGRGLSPRRPPPPAEGNSAGERPAHLLLLPAQNPAGLRASGAARAESIDQISLPDSSC